MIETFKNEVITHYADFSGKTTRRDFWMTILASFLLGIVLGIVSGILGKIGVILTALVELALLIPSLAMSVRRLHSIDKSGWWLLISLTGIGSIVLFIFYCMKEK